ncbi:cell surface protein [Bacillus cereus]|nr:cell surface protein [Bacillus cereus]
MLGSNVPIRIPELGTIPGCVTSFIVTLFGMKVVPAGIGSVTSTFVAGTVPVFCKEIV